MQMKLRHSLQAILKKTPWCCRSGGHLHPFRRWLQTQPVVKIPLVATIMAFQLHREAFMGLSNRYCNMSHQGQKSSLVVHHHRSHSSLIVYRGQEVQRRGDDFSVSQRILHQRNVNSAGHERSSRTIHRRTSPSPPYWESNTEKSGMGDSTIASDSDSEFLFSCITTIMESRALLIP